MLPSKEDSRFEVGCYAVLLAKLLIALLPVRYFLANDESKIQLASGREDQLKRLLLYDLPKGSRVEIEEIPFGCDMSTNQKDQE